MNNDFKHLDTNHTIEAFAATVAPDEIIPYKEIVGATLSLHVFKPEGTAPTPAMVFFFGGGWIDGSPLQFYPQAVHLRAKGLTCICAEYRVQKKHASNAFASVRDACSAMRWIRAHADTLNIVSDKIIASGGSAGGHLAACTAMIDDVFESTDDLSIDPKPHLLVLLNPVLDTTKLPRYLARFDNEPEKANPMAFVRQGLPPTLIMTGTTDSITPIESAQIFTQSMLDAGNDCTLIPYENKGHAFFNYGQDEAHASFKATLQDIEKFLKQHGCL